MMELSVKSRTRIIMKLQPMKGAFAFVATAATLFLTGVVAKADTYTVKAGDTLSKIAKEKSTTVESLIKLNKLENPDLIFENQVLELGDTKANKKAPAVAAAPGPATQTNQAAPAPVATITVPAPSANYSTYNSTPVLANGNTAGETGTYAAARMAELTGVSASTWEAIIARESNGQVNAYNASGASGLFQTMPGWGSTATVEDQIQSAYNAYNAQGLSAWNY